MNSQAFAGSALVAFGVATGSLLAPQAASAIDFTFSFGQGSADTSGLTSVSGLITGLVEGTNSCTDKAGPCFVTVLNAGGTYFGHVVPTGNYFNNPVNSFGSYGGFVVAGGSITSYEFFGSVTGQLPVGQDVPVLILSSVVFFSYEFAAGGSYFQDADNPDYVGVDFSRYPVPVPNPASFSPVHTATSVPGPLPLFGAAAAFGFSRKLRNRIKVTRTTAPTRPAG